MLLVTYLLTGKLHVRSRFFRLEEAGSDHQIDVRFRVEIEWREEAITSPPISTFHVHCACSYDCFARQSVTAYPGR